MIVIRMGSDRGEHDGAKQRARAASAPLPGGKRGDDGAGTVRTRPSASISSGSLSASSVGT